MTWKNYKEIQIGDCGHPSLSVHCLSLLPSPPPSLLLSSVYPPATPKLEPCSVVFAYLGKTEEEPQTKQLEFEDVWLASQVEPLQDNFDILGRLTLGQTIRQENL